MRSSRIVTGMLLAGGMFLLAAGCAEKDQGLVTQDQAGDRAQARIRELEDQLAQCQGDLNACKEDALRLQSEIDRLRDQLAKGQDASPGWTAFPGGAMTSIEGTVLFDSGKRDLRAAGRKTLQSVADTIKSKYPDHEIFVFGHTDNEPIKYSKWEDNYELSCQRALTVVRNLRKMGAGNLMAACGWGESRPTAPNDSAASRQANRRVEIYALAPKAAAAQ